uniref:Uncharacterized protein n=1 Tax=Rhabditophanes sp. KR3021 TaxID=114890 RepID=A0AC35U782_9BILA
MLEIILDPIIGLLKWIIGSYVTVRICRFLYIFLNSLYGHFISKPCDLSSYIGTWAVVTGGTDGIGRAYISELATAKGINKFFLIGRNEQKLRTVKKEMESQHKVVVEYFVFDFEKDNLNNLESNLKKLDIGILINCAGMGPSGVANMVELPAGEASKILQVNLMGTVKMTELVLPSMVKKDKGIIVNFASATSWRPLPYMSAYPASKAGVSFFTSSLIDEFKHTNVKIQLLIPLLVATKIAFYEKKESNNLLVIDPQEYVRQAVKTLGNYPLTTGCFQHDLQIALCTLVSFNLFKLVFVPFGMLRIHKNRSKNFLDRSKKAE